MMCVHYKTWFIFILVLWILPMKTIVMIMLFKVVCMCVCMYALGCMCVCWSYTHRYSRRGKPEKASSFMMEMELELSRLKHERRFILLHIIWLYKIGFLLLLMPLISYLPFLFLEISKSSTVGYEYVNNSLFWFLNLK